MTEYMIKNFQKQNTNTQTAYQGIIPAFHEGIIRIPHKHSEKRRRGYIS
jgi:hypothetical protein